MNAKPLAELFAGLSGIFMSSIYPKAQIFDDTKFREKSLKMIGFDIKD